MGKGIKVFISSTFRDLDNERNYIVKSIFPRIISELHGKLVQEVDLRWGITEEQANSGLVVDLCLRYLLNSKPFIIGILGDRYGSSFKADGLHLSPAVRTAFPHVEQQLASGKSITEIEIINGALEATDDIKAIFFIKETSVPAPGETMEQFKKLCALKKRIREQNRFPVFTYNSLLDFDNIIEFITNGVPKDYRRPLDTDFSRAVSHTENKLNEYRTSAISDYSILKSIYRHLECGTPVSIVEGDAGIGKSTLVAHLGLDKEYKYRKFVHLYGDSLVVPLSTESFQKYFFHFALKLLRVEDTRVAEHDQFLVSAISRTKWCFVLDNINQSNLEMSYMPDVIKRFAEWMQTQFKTKLDYKILIVKNNDVPFPSRISDIADTYVLKPGRFFNPKAFVEQYMSEFSKCLTANQIHTLTSSRAAEIPLAMELICHYLRENVSFDQLNNSIEQFSKVNSWKEIIELYMKYLFMHCGKNDVKAIVTLLCAYSAPLSRTEMLDCCKVAPMQFNIIMSYLDKMLDTDQEGRVRFMNDTVRKAFISHLNITQEDISRCGKENFNYFYDRLRNLYTQEDFILESDDKFWIFYKYWESVIPAIYHWRYPRNASSLGKSFDVGSLLGMCGGRSYENSYQPYLSFVSGVVVSYVQRAQLFNRKHSKGQTTPEEVEKHEQWLKETGEKIKTMHSPYIYDVIHALESAKLANADENVKHLLSNPAFANRIIETRYFANSWQWLISRGHDIKDETIRKNTLFPNNGYHNVCLVLNLTEAAEFYTPKKGWRFHYSEDWNMNHIRECRRKDSVCKEYKDASYEGNVDFLDKPHKFGYIEYKNENHTRDIYAGEFRHGKRHGKGKYIYATGEIYDGDWHKGTRHGKGVFAYPDGTLYEGDFADGNWNGHGRLLYSNGDIYEGEFKDNRFEGKGRYTWASGSWSQGIWKNGQLVEGTAEHHCE